MLKYEYELSHGISDSHPNLLANQTVAPSFVDFLVSLTVGGVAPVVPYSPKVNLLPNYPNPFNPSTTISFVLDEQSYIEIRVFDLRGNVVRTLLTDELLAGSHSVEWDGKDSKMESLPSGTYLVTLKNQQSVFSEKIQLIK